MEADPSTTEMNSYMRFVVNEAPRGSSRCISNLTKRARSEGKGNLEIIKQRLDEDHEENSNNVRPSFSNQVFKTHFGLRKIFGDQKKNVLAREFKKKLFRNIQSSSPIEDHVYIP